ncbi:SRPBCC domain-containing protein [Gemmatimonas sp.]|uniref:SRPBCC domain-containing protein n=1 Tax=Gemmatimonas sp. TaxID=1962908 RepID=UPI0035621735
MPITDVISNAQDLTLTIIADHPVPVARLWDAYADPRQLERFWGPVEWPATFTRHDMAVGGESHYYMTGPDGTTSRGWLRFLKRITLHDHHALRAQAADLATNVQLLSDTQVRICRVIRGTVAQVWRAHHEPALLQQWLLGPDGWAMPVCDVATTIGAAYRYEWARADGTPRFGFEGELLEQTAPYRAVTSERMIDTPGPSTRNEMTLGETQGGTLLSLVITYPDKAMRDMILDTGMTTGMETSYARMEREVLAA